MSEGKAGRIARHFKTQLRYLDYRQRLHVLRELGKWNTCDKVRDKLRPLERLRFKWRLFCKYGPECAYCHRPYDWRHALTIDHVQPVSKGGSLRDVQNMVLACLGCNRAKGDSWPY